MSRTRLLLSIYKWIVQQIKRFIYREIPEDYAVILSEHSAYYRNLNESNREKFLQRLAVFIGDTSFSTKEGIKITRKVKVIISSAFIQITFGFKDYTLRDFNNIYIAPMAYSYKHIDHLLSGDVNISLMRVSMSWPCVKKGFKIEDDAVNVAIHEFGHCLTIENFSEPFVGNFFPKSRWMEWLKPAQRNMELIRSRKNKIIRNYAGSNIMEMFAVSLETFFERPVELKAQAPELFNTLKHMLQQDPTDIADPVL